MRKEERQRVSLQACITEIYLAGRGELLDAGWLEAGGLQQGASSSSDVGANRDANSTYWYVSTYFWGRRSLPGASTPPISGVSSSSLVPRTRRAQLDPLLPIVATVAKPGQTNISPRVSRPLRKFWIGSALMRAIGAFFFVMPGCLVTPYGRPCVTVRVGPLQSASLH